MSSSFSWSFWAGVWLPSTSFAGTTTSSPLWSAKNFSNAVTRLSTLTVTSSIWSSVGYGVAPEIEIRSVVWYSEPGDSITYGTLITIAPITTAATRLVTVAIATAHHHRRHQPRRGGVG